MKRFDVIDHTADIGIMAYGRDLREAFANAAYAMFTLLVDPEGVRETIVREIEVEAADRESLLVSMLNELLYVVDTERLLFKRFEVTHMSDTALGMRGYGEQIDPSRHELRGGVKAATYHMLKVESNDVTNVQVIFDV